MKTTDVLAQEFRNAGLKITPQRLSVFDALHACDDHPTAEQVYQQVIQSIPSVSMRTVYQTLNDLVAMGNWMHFETPMRRLVSTFAPTTTITRSATSVVR
ncbi:MAG: transcriptional repressor [Acidimicrobiia bacterium]|nr:transcriptional repressor [Acidimicrobiia bacterium]